MLNRLALSIVVLSLASGASFADDGLPDVSPRIAWYGTLGSGLAEAKRSGRPILLVSAAPQCLGVSGIW